MISDKLKQKLSGGQALRGTFVKLNCPAAVEILGYAGLDFVIIDGEHAPCDQIMLENLVRAGDCVGLPVIVRVPTADDIHILKAMDVGAAGVQIPGIETVAQAEDVVKAAKYAPMGRRGLSFAQRSACYGFMDKAEYLDTLTGMRHIQEEDIRFSAETDRIYDSSAAECVIHDPAHTKAIHVRKEGSLSTVVWNPWIAKSRRMPDFGDDEYLGMVCVETANAGNDFRILKQGDKQTLKVEIALQ